MSGGDLSRGDFVRFPIGLTAMGLTRFHSKVQLHGADKNIINHGADTNFT